MSHRIRCPIPVITYNGNLILAAGIKYPKVGARLPAGYLIDAAVALGKMPSDDATQKITKGETGNLTIAQQANLDALLHCMGQARKTARLAFLHQTVKLHQEFQIGNREHDLPAILAQADIILAAVQTPTNLPALKLKGWTDAETTNFATLRNTFPASTTTQSSGQSDAQKATGTKAADAADAYEHLLTIQNAADLEYPATDPANAPIRTEFRLGLFPPTHHTPPPPAPTGLTLTAAGPGKVAAAWALVANANTYGVWLQVAGVDPAYRQVATVDVLAYTFTNLPSGKTVNVQITGENDGGDGLPSDPVSIVVP